MAAALNEIIGNREDVLVVVSSDMSHFHTDEQARAMDKATLSVVKSLDTENFWRQCASRKLEMCGFVPVTTAMFLAKQRGLTGVEVLKYANSGDVTGDYSGVVGYAAGVIYKNNVQAKKRAGNKKVGVDLGLKDEEKELLHQIVKETIRSRLEGKSLPDFKVDSKTLKEPRGAFVSLHKGGMLRGCIGHLQADRPLYETIKDMYTIVVGCSDTFHRH